MAIKSKTQLTTDIGASTFTAPQQAILTDMVDSYEDIFAQVTTVQRDALTPVSGQIVYNTDNDRYEYWNGAQWLGIGQDLSTPLTVKVDLSSADILALDTTPITLVAAPGSGYALVPSLLAYRYTYGSTQYSGSYQVHVKCSTKTTADSFTFIQSASLNAASDRSGALSVSTGAGFNAITENDSIDLKSTAAISSGNGTLTVWLTYAIIAY